MEQQMTFRAGTVLKINGSQVLTSVGRAAEVRTVVRLCSASLGIPLFYFSLEFLIVLLDKGRQLQGQSVDAIVVHRPLAVCSISSEDVRASGVHVHQTVGAGVVKAPHTFSLELFPRCLSHRDVVELEPFAVLHAVDVGPVVTASGLTFVHQDGMQAIWMLKKEDDPSGWK